MNREEEPRVFSGYLGFLPFVHRSRVLANEMKT